MGKGLSRLPLRPPGWVKKKKKGQRDEGKRVGREKTEKEENGKEAGGRGEVTKATWTKQEARPSP